MPTTYINIFPTKKNINEITALLKAGVNPVYEDVVLGDVFSGAKVVLTGTLEKYKRSEAQKIIESLGGEVIGSVSKKTTMVLAGSEAGSKLTKAQELGIRIITEQEFDLMIGDLATK